MRSFKMIRVSLNGYVARMKKGNKREKHKGDCMCGMLIRQVLRSEEIYMYTKRGKKKKK